jgi:hypothetical protein
VFHAAARAAPVVASKFGYRTPHCVVTADGGPLVTKLSVAEIGLPRWLGCVEELRNTEMDPLLKTAATVMNSLRLGVSDC